MNIAIYGAGLYGKIAYKYFKNQGMNVLFFIVSQKQEDLIDGIVVKSVTELSEETGDLFEIYVATDKRYWDEISKCIDINLKKFDKKKIKFIPKEDIQKYNRLVNPVKLENFLSSVEPVSRMFGTDRGMAIDRYYIEYFLKKESDKIGDIQTTLEVGEDIYSKKFFLKAQHDVLDYQKGMDLTKKDSLPENKYDVFICTQTLHEIYDIKAAIKGAYYLLKNGGVLLATVAGSISQVASNDMKRHGDYWRFTELSIKMLMEEVFGDAVRVESFGNIMAATAFIQGISLEEIDQELLNDIDSDYSICIGIVAKKLKR